MIKFSKFLIALVPFLLASQFAFTQDAESSSAIIDTIKLGFVCSDSASALENADIL